MVIMDAIVRFVNEFNGKTANEISFSDMQDWLKKYVDERFSDE